MMIDIDAMIRKEIENGYGDANAQAYIYAFIKGYTPYPKWCVIFCVPVGMIISMLIGKIGNYNITNAIRCAWISIGNLYMLLGLLIMKNNYQMEKHKRIGI